MSRTSKFNLSRSPLKWAGGKRWLVPYLSSLWSGQKRRRLVEPFCGGLSVAIGLKPSRALINDINPHNINFFLQLQAGLCSEIRMENDEQLYYQHRDRFNTLIEQENSQCEEAASLFYYLNRTGFNGLCRFNKNGFYNVPFGKHKSINYRVDFSEYQPLFKNWRFTCTEFYALKLGKNDFVYADPPYDGTFNNYTKDGFDWEQQKKLAEWLSEHTGPVILSNQSTDRIKKLYRKLGYKIFEIEAPRMISCNGNRTPAKEVLALRNITALQGELTFLLDAA